MNKYVFFFLFLNCQFFIVKAQSFVKKDSSEVIPFTAKVYYSTDLDYLSTISPKIKTNHLLSPTLPNNELILLGNMGSELIPVLHVSNFHTNLGLGRTQLNSYFYSQENIPYFALNKPLSELDFIFFGNGNEIFSGLLSQDLSKKFNIGVGIKKHSNKGYFLRQENEHNNLYATLVYQAKNWRSNLEFLYNDASLKESGGYQQDIYNGNTSSSLWNTINPYFPSSENKFKNYKISWRNRILLGKVDSSSSDTLLFVPKKSNFYIDQSLQFSSDRWYYRDKLDSISKREYGIYGTQSTIETKNLIETYSNEFSLNYEDKNLKIRGFNTISISNIHHGKTFASDFFYDDNILFGIGGDIRYRINDKWQIEGNLYKALTGYTSQDMKISGEISSIQNDWKLNLLTKFQAQKPSYFYSHALSNVAEIFYDLQTENTLENSLTISNTKHNLIAKGQYFQIENYLVFDSTLSPIQLQNNFYQGYIRKEWKYKSLYFPTTLLYQNSIYQKGVLKQTVAYNNKLFSEKNNVLFGADLSLNYDFTSYKYSPFLMTQLYSESRSVLPVFPKLDLFATFKISKVHVSLVIDNFLSTYLQSGISYSRNYPITPSAFYFRANWVFLE